MCTCVGRNRCPYHQQLEQDRVASVQRSNENRLTALARKFDSELSNEQWCKLMYLYEQDDLDLLLFEGDAS